VTELEDEWAAGIGDAKMQQLKALLAELWDAINPRQTG